jgi:hypothetical protein
MTLYEKIGQKLNLVNFLIDQTEFFCPKIDFDQIKIWANWNCSAKLGKVNLTNYKFDQN